MCIDKRYVYSECGCAETDHFICAQNLNLHGGASSTTECKNYQGVGDVVKAGKCNRHEMQGGGEPVEGEGEGEREGRVEDEGGDTTDGGLEGCEGVRSCGGCALL